MATPMLEETRRCGSRVEVSATTAKTTSPGERYSTPSLRGTSLAFGGKIDETRTRFCAAIPASRSASSNEVRRSLCLPVPFVKNRRFGTMLLPNVRFLRMGGSGRAGFPSEKYHSNGDYLSGASREFMLFSQNTIEADFLYPSCVQKMGMRNLRISEDNQPDGGTVVARLTRTPARALCLQPDAEPVRRISPAGTAASLSEPRRCIGHGPVPRTRRRC